MKDVADYHVTCSNVKKTFEVKLSLLHKLIDVKCLIKFTSYKATVECSNPKDDL